MPDDDNSSENKVEADGEQKSPPSKEPRVPSLDDMPAMYGEEKKSEDVPPVAPSPKTPPLPDSQSDAKNEENIPEDTGAPPVDFGDLQKAMEERTKDSDSDEAEGETEDDGKTPIIRPEAVEGDVNYVTSNVTELKIGDDIGLTNKDQTLKKVIVGAGWEVKSFEGEDPDLDLSCFIYDKDRQTRKDEDFVFYNNRTSEEGELRHMGDSRTGAGEGDDESIEIDLQAFPFDVAGIMLVISIHDGEVNDQDFTMIKDVFVRILNAETGQELCKLEIPDDLLAEEGGFAMKVGRIFRDGPKWRFHAGTEIVQKGGLRAIATDYGMIIV